MKYSKILIFLLIVCVIIPNLFVVRAQQCDTLKINDSYPLFCVETSIDTFSIDYYNNGFIVNSKIYYLGSNELFQEIKDTITSQFGIYFKGISYLNQNLDEFNDIIFQYLDNNGNKNNSFWLFDTTQEKFVISEDFNKLYDPSIIDKKNKIIFDASPWYPGIFCATYYKYRIIGLRLTLIEEKGCYRYGENNDNYVSYTKQLLNNKKSTVSLDSIIHNNNNYIFKYYSFIQDSLLLSSTYWAEDYEVKNPHSNCSNIYIFSEFTGTLKCFRKEVYTYFVDSESHLKYKIDKFIVEDNMWKKL